MASAASRDTARRSCIGEPDFVADMSMTRWLSARSRRSRNVTSTLVGSSSSTPFMACHRPMTYQDFAAVCMLSTCRARYLSYADDEHRDGGCVVPPNLSAPAHLLPLVHDKPFLKGAATCARIGAATNLQRISPGPSSLDPGAVNPGSREGSTYRLASCRCRWSRS